MNIFDNSLKVKEALPLYFSRYHFKDGGYHDAWFKIKLGPVYVPVPNTKARLDAVKIHDIHHLVTEYEANMRGEVEISGWEIASGCGTYYMAWILNMGSFFYGILLHQRILLAAFLKGRKCKTNLYYKTPYDEVLLNKTIGELREEIGLNSRAKNSFRDYLAFVLYSLLCISLHFGFIFILFKLVSGLF